jgi:hypothetical protein
MPRPAERGAEITAEMIKLWTEGCALLDAMSPSEYHDGDSERYYRLRQIDKDLTWRLVSPGSVSLFDYILDEPAEKWTLPSSAMYADWIPARTWREALIQATGLKPKAFRYD